MHDNSVNIFLSENKLYCTIQEYHAALFQMFANIKASNKEHNPNASLFDIPTYRERVTKEVDKLNTDVKSRLKLTVDYSSDRLSNGAVAYHRIKGMIMGDSSWYFSTKQFIDDLLAADSNPAIGGHILHVTSGGGDAWLLDRAAETLRGLKKPVIGFVERGCCSAALYLTMQCDEVHAYTNFDTIGSLGVMVSYSNWDGYFEKLGVKFGEAYASRSDLKNKKGRDLENGKPKAFIESVLDPHCQQFVKDVLAGRPQLAELESSNHALFRGETFFAPEAVEMKLIDSVCTFEQMLARLEALINTNSINRIINK